MSDETCVYPRCYHPWDLEPYYSRHVSAMTTEGLHAKSDIAEQLAWRDKRLAESERKLAESEAAIDAYRDQRERFRLSLEESERKLAESEAKAAMLEGLFQQTHGCHWSWVHKVTELQAEIEKLRLRGVPIC